MGSPKLACSISRPNIHKDGPPAARPDYGPKSRKTVIKKKPKTGRWQPREISMTPARVRPPRRGPTQPPPPAEHVWASAVRRDDIPGAHDPSGAATAIRHRPGQPPGPARPATGGITQKRRLAAAAAAACRLPCVHLATRYPGTRDIVVSSSLVWFGHATVPR